jgi:PAS domain S-box-containing protein
VTAASDERPESASGAAAGPGLRRPFGTTLLVSLLFMGVVALASTLVEISAMFWLPSGVATVFAAIGGRRARAGALVAVLLVNALWIPQVMPRAPQVVALMLVAIGVGNWLQTGLAARLMRRALAGGNDVAEPASIQRFLLALALPGGISGLILVVMLVAGVQAPLTRSLMGGALWWLGDAVGGMLAGPFVASFVLHPAAVWRTRRWVAGATLTLAWAAIVPALMVVEAGHVQRQHARWQEHTDELAANIFNTVENAAEAARGLAAAVEVTQELPEELKRAKLNQFCETLRRPNHNVTLLGWARHVDAQSRDRFEIEKAVPVLDVAPNGVGTFPAARRAQHYALLVVAGPSDPAALLGVDLAQDEETHRRLDAAASAGEPLLFRAPALFASGNEHALAVYHPVYWDARMPAEISAREKALRGFVVTVLSSPVAAEHLADFVGAGASRLRIRDVTGGGDVVVYDQGTDASPGGPGPWLVRQTALRHHTASTVFGRQWVVETSTSADTDVFEPFDGWFGVGGLAFVLTALLQSLMLLLTGREAVMRRVVDQRTAVLETIREVQGRYIGAEVHAEGPDLEPLLRAIAASTGARTVRLVDCAECAGDDPACGHSPRNDQFVLRHGDRLLGRIELTGDLDPGGFEEARALAATAAALLGAARAEGARLETQRRYDLFMSHLPIAAFVKGEDGRYLYVNPAFEQTYCPVDGSIVGRVDAEVWPADVAQQLVALDAVSRSTAAPVEHELTLPGPDGVRTWRRVTFGMVGPSGTRYVAGLARDVTVEQRQDAELRASLREKEALLKEIHHRVKNNLQIVSSLLNLHRPDSADPAVTLFIDESRSRIRSIALLHETLYLSENLARIDFALYVRSLGAHLMRTYSASAPGVSLDLHIADVALILDQAIPCGLIINELVSNALKYAFPDKRPGRIDVRVGPVEGGAPDELVLAVVDDGVGLSEEFDPRTTRSLGLRLVSDLGAQLGGKLVLTGGPGTRAEIRFRALKS